MKISDYIRPNPDLFIEKTNELLATIKELMEVIAIETDNERKKELSKEIQEKLDFVKALAIRQEGKTSSEMINIFMEIVITQKPHLQMQQKTALCNAQTILGQLLSDYLQDVICRKGLITKLEKELKIASLQKEFVIEIMNEVHKKSRYLSEIMEEIIARHSNIDFSRAEIALGYLVLIPSTTEEEIEALGNRLISVSKHYSRPVAKYKAVIKRLISLTKKNGVLFGTYKEEIFATKITTFDSNETIICNVSITEKEVLRLEFNLITGTSSDGNGVLLGNTANMEMLNSQDAKPRKGKLAEYSEYVLVKWEENDEEKIGIGSYYFESNKWFISRRGSFEAIDISNSPVILWFYIPEDMKKNISGYNI